MLESREVHHFERDSFYLVRSAILNRSHQNRTCLVRPQLHSPVLINLEGPVELEMGFSIIVDELGMYTELLVHVGSFLFGDYRR